MVFYKKLGIWRRDNHCQPKPLAMVVAAFSHSLGSFGSCGCAAVTISVDVASRAYAMVKEEPQRYQWLVATAIPIAKFEMSQTQQITALRPRSAAYVMLRPHHHQHCKSWCGWWWGAAKRALKIRGLAVDALTAVSAIKSMHGDVLFLLLGSVARRISSCHGSFGCCGIRSGTLAGHLGHLGHLRDTCGTLARDTLKWETNWYLLLLF